MEDNANERYVSHATNWEVAIKLGLGRLKLHVPYEDLFPRAVAANYFVVLPPDFRHYLALLQLPFHHRDPFDRLLVAQAKAEGLTLLTCDPHMAACGVPLFW